MIPTRGFALFFSSLSVKHKSIKARLEKKGWGFLQQRPTSVVVLLQRVDATDVKMKPRRCCSQWGRRGFKPPQPGGTNTSKTGDTAIKGAMEPKRGRSNQQAYSQTYYEDAVAQPLPALASARSICRACAECKTRRQPRRSSLRLKRSPVWRRKAGV